MLRGFSNPTTTVLPVNPIMRDFFRNILRFVFMIIVSTPVVLICIKSAKLC